MEGRLVLKNCSVLGSTGQVTRAQAVLIEGSKVSRVEADAQLPALPGDWVVPCEGRLVMAGLVDCHSQLLASVGGRGRPTPGEAAAISAHALATGLRHGVTTHVDLLWLPDGVQAGLEAQAVVAQRLGARLIQAHASLNPAQLDANAAVSAAPPRGPVRTALGLWSSARCDDECLAHAGRVRAQLDCGVHLRLAESEEDLGVTRARFGKPIAERLDGYGLLTPRSVGAFARSLDGPGAQLVAKRGMLVAPWVDAAHPARFEAMLEAGLALGPGTAGQRRIWDAVASAVEAVTTVGRAGWMQRGAELPWALLFEGPARLTSAVFGEKVGAIAVGHLADLVVLDAVEAGTAIGWERLPLAPVAWAIVDGRVVVREGQLVGSDFVELANEAARAVAAVWARA